MQPLTLTRRFALVTAIGLAVAACGGSDGDDSAPATDAPAEAPAEAGSDADTDTEAESDSETEAESETGEGTEGSADEVTGDESTADGAGGDEATDDPATDGGSGSYEEGDIRFRAVNLLDRPVDIYVRTTGLVEAFPIEAGVAPGAVTEYAAPPQDGSYVVTEAGAGDATCVTECDHFVANLSGAFGEGPTRLVLLYDDEFSGASAFDLSEEPNSVESAAQSGNLLRPADPATGMVFPVGVALDPEVFGFRVGFTGVDGCVDAIDQENILVGGNQTPAYPYPGDSTDLLLFEQPDQDCLDPVATFPVQGGPGTRTLVALQGAGDTGVTVELSGSVAGATSGDEDAVGEIPAGRDEFVEALLADAPPGTDEQCVRDVVDSLSDSDLQIIAENLDSEDVPPELSAEALETLAGILDCAP